MMSNILTNLMNDNKETNNNDSGRAFESQQRAIDTAVNEKIKDEKGTDRLDPQANRKENRVHKTDVSRKKTGGGKQSSPGD
jgi:hypothetical protein